ncbi:MULTISPECIES: hypothetical protein [Dyella]|uniref:DUF4097 domain-containing protein n=2 Tax=Dyella TaxID=231454 RepID=A0A4R0YSN8_9GAMM|nr:MULTISPECIES: hypothetical protein [Dyella]TBR40175.1 hypothetical protein EYV96_08410 [Dyella terrae]TCI12242.1 hypothetical protein EZM97_02460 [Dyella soli]
MRHLFLASLLLLPFAAHAGDSNCRHTAPRELKLDLAGVKSVQVEVRSYDLHVNGVAGSTGEIKGVACASDEKLLPDLVITQHKEGDQLIVEMGTSGRHISINFFGSTSTGLKADMTLPANMPLTVNVGSGDGWVNNVARLDSRVGSGDLHVTKVSGPVSASVGSGDMDVKDIGSLDLGAVGSGDFKGQGINGDARIGSIGSGDVELRDVKGSVRADTLGSGDLTVKGVGGDLSLGAKGSGDVNHSDVRGKVNVPRDRD